MEHKLSPSRFVREGLICEWSQLWSQLGLRNVRFGRGRVVSPAPEQTVYSVRYVVVDRVDHVRVTAGHGGLDPSMTAVATLSRSNM